MPPQIVTVLALLIAAEHLGFMALETLFWTKPLGLRIFGQTEAQAVASAALAANQGLYNGFLAAGLAYAVFVGDARFTNFFLGSVAVAGIFGAATVSKRIFFVQAVPALIALALSLLTKV